MEPKVSRKENNFFTLEVEEAFLRTELVNISYVWAKLARGRFFQNSNEKFVDNFKGLINWVAMTSNEGLTLHVGQFTLWTQSIKPNLFCNNPPTQRLSFFRNYPPFILNFWKNPWPLVIVFSLFIIYESMKYHNYVRCFEIIISLILPCTVNVSW